MAGDGLLLDVADAVASSEQVDWDRAHGAARRDQRRSLDNLRALSEMATSVGARTPSGPDTAGSRDPLGTPSCVSHSVPLLPWRRCRSRPGW